MINPNSSTRACLFHKITIHDITLGTPDIHRPAYVITMVADVLTPNRRHQLQLWLWDYTVAWHGYQFTVFKQKVFESRHEVGNPLVSFSLANSPSRGDNAVCVGLSFYVFANWHDFSWWPKDLWRIIIDLARSFYHFWLWRAILTLRLPVKIQYTPTS